MKILKYYNHFFNEDTYIENSIEDELWYMIHHNSNINTIKEVIKNDVDFNI